MKRAVIMAPMHPGSTQVEVYRPGNRSPHFVVTGADMSDLDIKRVTEYMYGCDWTDRGSRGWITPQLKCDDFLKAPEEREDKQRCNHCMTVFDEEAMECPHCGKDDALMCPFTPSPEDKEIE